MRILLSMMLLAGVQGDAPYHCDTCKKDVAADAVEMRGHEPNEAHMHPAPCAALAHVACGSNVRCADCAKGKKGCDRCTKAFKEGVWEERAAERANVDEDYGTKPGLLVFAGLKDDLADRAKAHRAKDEAAIKKLPAIPKDKEARVYLLWGWSPNGLDPLRRARVSAVINPKKKTIRITATLAEYKSTKDFGGTDDIVYIGFGVPLGALAAGDYTVEIYEVVETYENPRDKAPKAGERKLAQTFTFTVK